MRNKELLNCPDLFFCPATQGYLHACFLLAPTLRLRLGVTTKVAAGFLDPNLTANNVWDEQKLAEAK